MVFIKKLGAFVNITALLMHSNIVSSFLKTCNTHQHTFISKIKQNPNNIFSCKTQTRLYSKKTNIPQKNLAPRYIPKTENQRKYFELLNNQDKSLIVVIGPAGSGKTLLACSQAMEDLKANKINKIIITRPMVSVEDEEIGFLPGNLVSKMDPWTRPMMDIFQEYYSKKDINDMINNGVIEICPLAYMRGRTFHKSYIIADEMQNSTPTQMLMLATRIGSQSKMVMMGDIKQSDRATSLEKNGLSDFLDKYNKRVEHETYEMGVIELTREDILRSTIVSQVIDMYSNSN